MLAAFRNCRCKCRSPGTLQPLHLSRVAACVRKFENIPLVLAVRTTFDRNDIMPLCMAFLVVIVDQLTKLWVMSTFALYEQLKIIPGIFNLVYVRNTGAAFGFLAGEKSWLRQAFFIGVAIIALIVIFLVIVDLFIILNRHCYRPAQELDLISTDD